MESIYKVLILKIEFTVQVYAEEYLKCIILFYLDCECTDQVYITGPEIIAESQFSHEVLVSSLKTSGNCVLVKKNINIFKY